MATDRSAFSGQICPHIDSADSRCSEHLSLNHIQDAFELCACNFEHCPVYERRKHERRTARRQTESKLAG